jgi:hypothetical protein
MPSTLGNNLLKNVFGSANHSMWNFSQISCSKHCVGMSLFIYGIFLLMFPKKTYILTPVCRFLYFHFVIDRTQNLNKEHQNIFKRHLSFLWQSVFPSLEIDLKGTVSRNFRPLWFFHQTIPLRAFSQMASNSSRYYSSAVAKIGFYSLNATGEADFFSRAPR